MKQFKLLFAGILFLVTLSILIYFVLLNYDHSKVIKTSSNNKPVIGLTLTKIIIFRPDSWQYVLKTAKMCDADLFADNSKIAEASSDRPPIYDENKIYCLRYKNLNFQYEYLILDANQANFIVEQSPEDFLKLTSSNENLNYAYKPLTTTKTCQASSFTDGSSQNLQKGEEIAINEKDYNTDYCFRSTNKFLFHSYLKLRIKYPTFLSIPSFRLTQNEATITVSSASKNAALDHLNDWDYIVSEQNLGCWGRLFKTITAVKGREVQLNSQNINKHYCFRAFNSISKKFEYEYIFANTGMEHQKNDGSTVVISPLVVNLAERMQLTDLGKKIFYDSDPIVYDDAVAFEKCCGQGNGYYDAQHIHLRGPTIPKIRAGHTSAYGWYESVAAHELMHAVLLVEGLPELRKIIEPYYDFKDIFINHYTFGHLYDEFEFWQVISEVHSVIIQKAVDLPPELNAHYNRYFKNRHLIRNFDALSGFTDILPPAKTP